MIKIEKVDNSKQTTLYFKRPFDLRERPIFMYLDCRQKDVWCAVSQDDGVPEPVFNGHWQRWKVGTLRSDAANKLMERFVPLFERIIAGYTYSSQIDHGVYTADAETTIEEIKWSIEREYDPTDYVMIYEADDWFVNSPPVEVKATTTDDEIESLAELYLINAAGDADDIEGIVPYLKEYRNQLKTLSRKDQPNM